MFKDASKKQLLSNPITLKPKSSRPLNNFFKGSILGDFTNIKNLTHADFDDETRLFRKNFGKTTPIRLLKYPSNDLVMKPTLDKSVSNIELFRFRFNEKNKTVAAKPIKPIVYLTFKQKRYNQRVNISKKTNLFLDKTTNTNRKYSGNPFLENNSIIGENFGNPTRQYKLLKKAKARLDTTKVSNWNRLLRSRRVLVLPAHVNITVITNSFDVVHS